MKRLNRNPEKGADPSLIRKTVMIKKLPFVFTLLSLLLFLNACEAGNATQLRGIVLYPSDLMSLGANWWVDVMEQSELNLLGIHTDTRLETLPKLKSYLESEEGKALWNLCLEKGIDVEFELHVLQDLLPRSLFNDHPEYFRMDKKGVRQQQHNMCFASEEAYKVIEKSITELCEWLKPTTHRYFFWIDDVQNSYCHCEHCVRYSESEQALMYSNQLIQILKKIDPEASIAHLAYNKTLPAPINVKPADGVFLEYAPINRDYTQNLPDGHLQSLKDNLEMFPKETAHVLEYWLDASMFCRWKKDTRVEIPWKKEYGERDVKLYRDLGINSVTTFATWIDRTYVGLYGEEKTKSMINEYGSVLNKKR